MKTHEFMVINGDTDSIMFCRKDGLPISTDDRQTLLDELNSLMPEFIKWADDKYYNSVAIIKAKNYVMNREDGKKITKGSAVTDQKREPALREMLELILDCLLNKGSVDECLSIYHKYVKEIYNLTNINRWATKKTVTEAVLKSDRTNEVKVRNALTGTTLQQGDKVYLYSAMGNLVQIGTNKKGEPKFDFEYPLKLADKFDPKAPDHDIDHLLKRVYDTICILENILDINKFLNYNLKRNKQKLTELLHG